MQATFSTERQFGCNHCKEKFTENRKAPMIMQCGHTVCRTCLTFSGLNHYIECKECKRWTPARNVSKNYNLLKILEERGLLDVEANGSAQARASNPRNINRAIDRTAVEPENVEEKIRTGIKPLENAFEEICGCLDDLLTLAKNCPDSLAPRMVSIVQEVTNMVERAVNPQICQETVDILYAHLEHQQLEQERERLRDEAYRLRRERELENSALRQHILALSESLDADSHFIDFITNYPGLMRIENLSRYLNQYEYEAQVYGYQSLSDEARYWILRLDGDDRYFDRETRNIDAGQTIRVTEGSRGSRMRVVNLSDFEHNNIERGAIWRAFNPLEEGEDQ